MRRALCCHPAFTCVSPLKYPHFFLCSLIQVYPVLSLFRHIQLSQWLSCPVARSSYMLTKPACAFSSSCYLPTPMTLANVGSPMFPLVVQQPACPSIWPAVQSLRRGLSTNPGRQCDAYVSAVEEMMSVVRVDVTEGA